MTEEQYQTLHSYQIALRDLVITLNGNEKQRVKQEIANVEKELKKFK